MKNRDEIIELFNSQVKKLKNGELKAWWIILINTVGQDKRSIVLSNDMFISQGGAHLTKKHAVIKATNALNDAGLVYKVRDDVHYNRYSIPANLWGVPDLANTKTHKLNIFKR